MFGIGPSELIFILVIALLVLGPKRLPELAAGIGKGLAEFRRATADINAELDEARRSLEDQAREATKTTQAAARVSRTSRTMPRTTAAAPTVDAGDSDHDASSDADAAPVAGNSGKDTHDPDPTASA